MRSSRNYDIFRALFPSGSIMAAKIRTMQIIATSKPSPAASTRSYRPHHPARPGQPRRATFNVAIRTLTLNEATLTWA